MKKMLMMCLLALAGCQKEAPDVAAPPAPQAAAVTPAASVPAAAPTPAPMSPEVQTEIKKSAPKPTVPAKVAVAPTPQAPPVAPSVATPVAPTEPPKMAEPAPAPAAAPVVEAAVPQADALALAKKKNCFACHALDKKVVGPAWRDVAQRYRGDAGAQSRLEAKVRQGGKGVWGSIAMPPQALSADEASLLVHFVLQLQ